MCYGAAGLEQFRGIIDTADKHGWRGASMKNVLAAMKDAGIEYEYTYKRDYDLLRRGVAAGIGCYIEIPGHALYLCGIDDTGVRVIDNNGSLEVQEWPMRTFAARWEGHACFPKVKPRPSQPRPGPSAPHPPLTPVKPQPEPVKPPAPPCPPENEQLKVLLVEITKLRQEIAAIQLKAGPPGKDGRPGVDGAPGSPGPAGPAGPPGKDADPATLAELRAELEKLRKALYIAELYDERGNLLQRVEFGVGVPLKLELVPVKPVPPK